MINQESWPTLKTTSTMNELSTTEAKQPRVLHLTLKKKWFDMILSGEKKEEYRERKPYWAIRFLKQGMKDVCAAYAGANDRWEHFDVVVFKNGYSKNAPTMKVEVNGILLGNGRPEWGAIRRCIIIKLGRIISANNLKIPAGNSKTVAKNILQSI